MLLKLISYFKTSFIMFNNINSISEKKPKFIFYSENKVYLKYAYLLIEYLSKKFPGEVYYVSSDINDIIINLDVKNLYIGDGFLFQYFFKKIVTDNLFLTIPDLDNNIVRKNKFVKNYIYFFHGPVSTSKIHTPGAFDNYDTVLCNGDYQIKEIEHRENLKNLKKKKLIKSGFFYFDYLKNKINFNDECNEILIAPSWNKNKKNFINEDFKDILINLLKLNYKIRFRPHPETLKRSPNLMNFYKKTFENKNFIFDESAGNHQAMQKAKCLITDYSGISIEYMMIFKKPVIYYNDSEEIYNKDFYMFKEFKPIEDQIKDAFGFKFNNNQIIKIKEIIDRAINNFDKNEIDKFLNKNFYNYGKTIEYFDENLSKICS